MKIYNFLLLIAVIGGINWGLVGLLDFNLVSYIFGELSLITRIIYIIIGASSLYLGGCILFNMLKKAAAV